MAKPLGAKALLIREAIKAHPKKGNKEIAELLNDAPERMDDKISVKPGDVAQQKQAMKKRRTSESAPKPAPAPQKTKEEAPAARKRGRPRGRRPKTVPAPKAQRAAAQASPVDLLDKVFTLAQECGGVGTLKKLVDRIAEVQGQ